MANTKLFVNGKLDQPCQQCGCEITPLNASFQGNANRSVRKCCKSCYSKKQTALKIKRRNNDPNVLTKDRRSRLRLRFGISLEEYNKLLFQQNYVCAICGEKDKTGRNLCVDHDHETGEIRGLLCISCNTIVGHCKEDRTILYKISDYLFKYNYTLETREWLRQRNEYSPG